MSVNHHPQWRVRCLSVPGEDTDMSLYVSFDNARYLFGCGEGTQRAFAQKRLTLRGLSGIFLGSGNNRSRAGLSGLTMTLADAGIKKLDIVGPPDTNHYIATLRSCLQRDGIDIATFPFPVDAGPSEPKQVFQSSYIKVDAIALRTTSNSGGKSITDEYLADPGPSSKQPLPFDPRLSTFRPSRLSEAHLRLWTDTIVGDMFAKRLQYRAPSPSSFSASPPRISPLIQADGTLRAARADVRFAIPRAATVDVETEMVYICQAPDVRGKFDVKRATALGVPNGPARGQLTRGEAIEVMDEKVEGGKRIIRPEDCMTSSTPGAVLIVINCSEKNLTQLLSASHLHKYQVNRSSDAIKVHLIVHRVPRSLWLRSEYQTWMKMFGDDTHHLLADTELKSRDTFFRSAAWNTLQLSLLNPDIFRTPTSSSTVALPAVALTRNLDLLVPNHEIQMHPSKAPAILPQLPKDRPFPSRSEELAWAQDVLEKELPEYAAACADARAAVEGDSRSRIQKTPQPGDDIVVTTLGTGSAIPSKYRNVSCTHLDIPAVGGILLDCGEGSLGQLRRRFGPEGMKQLYDELKMIFISHMHADHHLGLQAILRNRFESGASKPLFLVAPVQIAMALQESATWQHGAAQEALDNVIFINNLLFSKRESVNYDSGSRSPSRTSTLWRTGSGWPNEDLFLIGPAADARHDDNANRLKSVLGLKSIQVPKVKHRGVAFGLAMEHESGWKVVYSGDTMPCDSLVEAGRDATLLIHEATLEDDKPDVAAQKGHSTSSQAIEIGRRMKASHVLLNHFSQRYPKLPKLTTLTKSDNPPEMDVEEGRNEPVVAVSFDFMSIRVDEMWKMAHYMDALNLLFEEIEPEEGDDTTQAVEHDLNATNEVTGESRINGSSNGIERGKKSSSKGDSNVKVDDLNKTKQKNSGTGRKAKNKVKQVAKGKREQAEEEAVNGEMNGVTEAAGELASVSLHGLNGKRECSPSSLESEGKRKKCET